MSLLKLFRQELTLDEAIRRSGELADLVRETYSPDLIIGIAAGGVLPANEISKVLNVDYGQLTIRRDIDLHETYSSVPKALLPFVKLYQGYLFMTTNPTLIERGDFICGNMNVLLVDDTIHTGKTLQIAIDNLRQRGARQIKTAAINYVDGVCPDYFMIKGRIKFPWSKNSPDYERFKLYADTVSEYKTSSSLNSSTTLRSQPLASGQLTGI